MANPKDHIAPCRARHAAHLLAEASRRGAADNFAGKRRWRRYAYGVSITVSTDPQDAAASWSVALHNISGGGLGVWSKRRIEIRETIYVLDAPDGTASGWAPARVVSCVAGLSGFLIGAAFNDPALADAFLATDSGTARDHPEEKPLESRPPASTPRRLVRRDSLRVHCALASAATSLVGIMAITVAQRFAGALRWPMWVLVLSSVLALSAVIGWITARDMVRFLSRLHTLVRRLAAGETVAYPDDDAPSSEMQALRRSVVDLARTLERREVDERMRREKLEEVNQIKSNILAIVSHDLRTPLTSILLYSQMLIEELGTLPPEEQRRFLDIIAQECTRLSRLVDDLLDLQRLEAGQVKWDLRPQDLSNTIRSAARVFDALAQSKSIELKVECPESLPPVEADAGKVSQVVNNLLSNAMKYTQVGGKVRLWANATGNELLLGVADNGPGIPRDKWEQIFERFSQLSSPNVREISGVGLGLYIVRQIVEWHGGAVWVDSEIGRGSEFYISLPIKSADAAAVSTPNKTVPAGRVLVCDTDPALAAQIAQALRHENFDVRIAHSACRLLALLSQGETDVVVTDVLMPDMDTRELLEALARVPNRAFRLVVHSFVGEGHDLRRRGVDVYLRRPASRGEMVQAVRVALQKHPGSGLRAVIVESGSIDASRIGQLLLGAGHTPILARSVPAVADVIRKTAASLVIVAQDALEGGPAGLRHLGIRKDDAVRVLILCPRVRERARRAFAAARAGTVTLLPYRRGAEEQILPAVVEAEPAAGELIAEVV